VRLICNILSVVVLVGCLATAVAVAREQKRPQKQVWCKNPDNYTLTPEELETVLRNHQAWLQSGRQPNDTRRVNLCSADLQGANLEKANLQRAGLFGTDLQKANLRGADLRQTDLRWANLEGADLLATNLEGAKLFQANLQEANLLGANLQDAILILTNLQGVVFEPIPGKLPDFLPQMAVSNNLDKLVFHFSPAALVALREAFKKGGMRTEERRLTYAIERSRRLRAWNPMWYDPKENDTRPWLKKLAGKSESLFSYILFELPSHYGMAPGRALWGLVGFIPAFALVYWLALQHATSRSGLWMIVPANRLARGRGHERVVRIRLQTAKTWRERLRGEFRLFHTSLYFSLLSTFHLGWREFNVGTWIARMQSREYTLRATGWVRTVSGVQSLLSVYLLALWVLTYFGRPFE
jgi:hypothetical protein